MERRQLHRCATCLALVALLLCGCAALRSEPTPAPVEATEAPRDYTPSITHYRFPLGGMECVCLYDGGNKYSIPEKFAGVPLEEVEEALLRHDLPTTSAWAPYTMFYVDTSDHQVLVDMGLGRIVMTMDEAGIDPAGIDAVMITHAHPDHIGRALDHKGEPRYANATHYISKVEYDYWMSDDPPPEASSWFVDVARKNLEGLEGQLELLDGEAEIVPGIRAIPAPGHTPGHMIVSVTSGDEQLLYIADAATHILHLEHPDWQGAFDIMPEQALATKRAILNQAAEQGILVVATHLAPFPSLGTVVRQEEGWLWQPAELDESGQP